MTPLLLVLVLGPLLLALATWIFKWLWNTTMPVVFDMRQITFWQALRLLLLAGFLFGGGSLLKITTGA